MECMVKLQRRPKFIDMIEKFLLSGYYPVLFAILCTISGLGNKYVYLPILSILAISVLFSVLFVRDKKVFVVPMFMIFYSLGSDSYGSFSVSHGNMISSFDPDGFVGICILASIVIIPFVLRFILDGSFAMAFKDRSLTFYGILFFTAATLLGGLLSEHWTPPSLLYGFIIVAGLDVFYIISYSIVKQSQTLSMTYACKILVLACLMISTQVIIHAIRLHFSGMLFVLDEQSNNMILQRGNLSMSWGVATVVGASSALGIPAAMYLAKDERFPLLYYISALVMLGVSFLVNTRSSMLVGGVFLVIGMFFVSFFGKNKRCNLIFSAVICFTMACGVIVAIVWLFQNPPSTDLLPELFKRFRLDSTSDRLLLYKIGLRNFLNYPLFGIGWDSNTIPIDIRFSNFYSNMYHCILIQIGASTGVFGIIAFAVHIKDIFNLCFKPIRIDRIFALAVPIMILSMSLVDNFFFYLNFQIVYIAFLLLAEKHFIEMENKTA